MRANLLHGQVADVEEFIKNLGSENWKAVWDSEGTHSVDQNDSSEQSVQ